MLSRPLLLQRRLISQTTATSSRLLGNAALRRTVTPKCTPPLHFASALKPTPSLVVPCRPFSVSFVRRSVAAEAATTATPPSESTTSKDNVAEQNQDSDDIYNKLYVGPLESTFRRLKIFSLASLTLSTTLAPFIFVIESNLPPTARLALASIAITTSATSTGLVAWVGKPYVTRLRYIRPEENGGAEGIEMTTMSLFMKESVTTVYDPSFLVETRRAFAKWELAQKVVLPKEEECPRQVTPGQEETIAETRDKGGNPIGRWVVTWGENGEGTCRELGHVVRHFNVHEELLP